MANSKTLSRIPVDSKRMPFVMNRRWCAFIRAKNLVLGRQAGPPCGTKLTPWLIANCYLLFAFQERIHYSFVTGGIET
jgi:hypothetical protein